MLGILGVLGILGILAGHLARHLACSFTCSLNAPFVLSRSQNVANWIPNLLLGLHGSFLLRNFGHHNLVLPVVPEAGQDLLQAEQSQSQEASKNTISDIPTLSPKHSFQGLHSGFRFH